MRRLTTLAALAVLAPAFAHAQQLQCADRGLVTDRLADAYGETFAGGGLGNATSLFEVWTSDETGTWTILMTRADGQSCIVATGTHWQDPLPSDMVAGIPG
jgi:hypothetical protein